MEWNKADSRPRLGWIPRTGRIVSLILALVCLVLLALYALGNREGFGDRALYGLLAALDLLGSPLAALSVAMALFSLFRVVWPQEGRGRLRSAVAIILYALLAMLGAFSLSLSTAVAALAR
jgi:hypothetical protein